MAMRPEGVDYHAAQRKIISVRGNRMWASGFQPVGLAAQRHYRNAVRLAQPSHPISATAESLPWSQSGSTRTLVTTASGTSCLSLFPNEALNRRIPTPPQVWILRRISTDKIR